DAVLRLYTNPARLVEELPTLRWLSRDVTAIEQLATRLAPIVQRYCEDFQVTAEHTYSQVGSGALPVDRLESVALKLTRPDVRRPGNALKRLARAFRALPIPVVGRITDDALWFDLRCLEDEAEFVDNLRGLAIA
ncbi:MAG: L-seryl-tRNA(Sec) selenium transferase, partial [Gammaproteobacteria bacterium]